MYVRAHIMLARVTNVLALCNHFLRFTWSSSLERLLFGEAVGLVRSILFRIRNNPPGRATQNLAEIEHLSLIHECYHHSSN